MVSNVLSRGKPRISAADIKQACRGHWPGIIAALTGIDMSILDGHHHPCPACGGKDRFRAFNDFQETGGAICSRCHPENCRDGISSLMWLTGWDFKTTINRLAEYLQLGQASPARIRRQTVRVDLPERERKPFQPLRTTGPVDRGQLDTFCRDRKTSTPDGLVQAGVRATRYAGQDCFSFLSFPNAEDSAQPVGEVAFRRDGEPFPAYGGRPEKRMLNTRGSRDSWIFANGKEQTRQARIIWKCEGVSDALTLAPMLPDDHAAVTNICGCQALTKPLDIFQGKERILIVGDADVPGQAGAQKFGLHLTQHVDCPVKLVPLPYTVEQSHGRDLRDYINAGGRVV